MSEEKSKYELLTYQGIDVYPVSEFWHAGRPWLYIGAETGPDGNFIWVYDVNNRVEVETTPDEKTFSFFDVVVEGERISNKGEWPEEYINSLPVYCFISKDIANSHGHQASHKIHLVFKYNEDFGLFRVGKGMFRNIYLKEVTQMLTLF